MADASGSPRPVAPAPPPADIGVVAALPIEVGPLLARFNNVRKYSNERRTFIEGELAGKLIALTIAGPGRKAAARAARLLLAGHRPRWMLSAGFAGALDPSLRRNTIVLANEVCDLDGLHLAIDVGVPSGEHGPVAGRLLTVDQIIRTAAEKAALRERHAADIVDMETSAVAALCATLGVRFMAIRVISDDAAHDLPPEIATILGRTGGYRVGAAVGALWRRPSAIKDLWRLREHAQDAARALAEATAAIIAQLP